MSARQLLVFKILFLVLIAHSSRLFEAVKVESISAPEQLQARNAQKSKRLESQQVKPKPTIASLSLTSSFRAANEEADPAELCYLKDGSSALTLTVDESTKVGTIVGSLEVNGDPNLESGDVELVEVTRALDSIQAADLVDSASGSRRQVSNRRARARSNPPDQLQQQQQHQQPQHQADQQAGEIKQAPLGLVPGTKSLVLLRELDKESAEGEQVVLIQVRCSARLKSSSAAGKLQSTIIPIRLLVTDANDHAPEFLMSSHMFVLNVSEATPIGSILATRELQAIDKDATGPHSTIHYKVDESSSPSAHLFHFPNPLESTLQLVGQLDYETLGPELKLTILAQDLGEPEPLSGRLELQINLLDFDDQNPKFEEEKYLLEMDERKQENKLQVGQSLQVKPRSLHAEDGDRGIQAQIVYSFELPSQQTTLTTGISTGQVLQTTINTSQQQQAADDIRHFLHLGPTSGQLRLIRAWPANLLSQPLTLVVRATQADNKDRYTLTTLTVLPANYSPQEIKPLPVASNAKSSASADRDLRLEFASEQVAFEVSELAKVGEKLGKVESRFVGAQSGTGSGQFGPINYQILDDDHDQFAVSQEGELLLRRPLDYEQRKEYQLRLLASYSKFSDICQIQLTVINENDNRPKFTQPHFTFHLSEPKLAANQTTATAATQQAPHLLGQVQAQDLDLNESLNYALIATDETSKPLLRLLHLNPKSGQLSVNLRQINLRQFASANANSNSPQSQIQLAVEVSDTLRGPRTPIGHRQLAKLTILLAPQLLGRSLSFANQQQPPIQSRSSSAASSSSSTLAQSQPELTATAAASPDEQQQQAARHFRGLVAASEQPRQVQPASQRSSVATVVSSLQHMVRGLSLSEMPLSSALLLSALLALLVCLLLILLVSMSIHLYRRHTKPMQRPLHLSRPFQHQHHQQQHVTPVPPPPPPSHVTPNSMARLLIGPGKSRISPSSSSPSSSIEQQQQQQQLEKRYFQHRLASEQQIYSQQLRQLNLEEANLQANPTRRPVKVKLKSLTPSPVKVIASPRLSCLLEQRSPDAQSKATQVEADPRVVNSDEDEDDEDQSVKCGHYSLRSPKRQTKLTLPLAMSLPPPLDITSKLTNSVGQQNCTTRNELAGLTSPGSQLDFRAYRKLESACSNGPQSSPLITKNRKENENSIQLDRNEQIYQAGSLMEMISDRLKGSKVSDQISNGQAEPSICWPTDLIPQRTKRLTWDDELSLDETSEEQNSHLELTKPEVQTSDQPRNFLYLSGELPSLASPSSNKWQLDSPKCQPMSPKRLKQHEDEDQVDPDDDGLQLAECVDQTGNILGQDNCCFDYTIVQSSQFHVGQLNSLMANEHQHLSPSEKSCSNLATGTNQIKQDLACSKVAIL